MGNFWAIIGLHFLILLHFFFIFSNKHYNFYNKYMWKMSIEYRVLGYEPTTSKNSVLSLDTFYLVTLCRLLSSLSHSLDSSIIKIAKQLFGQKFVEEFHERCEMLVNVINFFVENLYLLRNRRKKVNLKTALAFHFHVDLGIERNS